MPNLNSLIITAADYKVVLSVPGTSGPGRFPLITLTDISWNIKRDAETVYAVGNTNPIGNKRNAISYEGKFSMQAGEMNALLALCGFSESTQIEGATLGIVAIAGGFARVFGGVNINSEDFSTKAKDKESKIDVNFTALSVG